MLWSYGSDVHTNIIPVYLPATYERVRWAVENSIGVCAELKGKREGEYTKYVADDREEQDTVGE